MAGFYGIEHKEVVRVKVKKYEGFLQPECKKFSLDPQITSFEMLQHIIANAFSIQGDFTMSYLAKDDEGQEIYLSMLSDWDMDAAIQSAADPCLNLKVDTKPFEEGLDDWDIIAPVEIPQHKIYSLMDKNSLLGSLTGTISSGVGKTFSSMQRAMGFKNEDELKYKPLKHSMTDQEFRNYLDSCGHLIKPEEFRLSIYQGGVEPSLRRVTWRHLLNIFPEGMSGKERFDYMKKKEQEYYKLRDQWQSHLKNGDVSEEIKYVTTMVKKDVLRTDRTHKFYSGADDNKNLLALFNLLVTYALTHPEISYCQGMSDIASPLLVTQKDEAQAYLCLCGMMKRLRTNFHYNGQAITLKFKHLSDLLKLHDPVLFTYLQDINAHDLFFCYRWLLLELKREFPFDDALYMLEVMWSTLPPDPPEQELRLTDEDYTPDLLSTSPCSPSFTMKQTVYAKLIAMRRNHSSSKSIPRETSKDSSESKEREIASGSANNNSRITLSQSLSDKQEDDKTKEQENDMAISQEYPTLETEETRKSVARSCSIDRTLEMTLNGQNLSQPMKSIEENEIKIGEEIEKALEDVKLDPSPELTPLCIKGTENGELSHLHNEINLTNGGRGDEISEVDDVENESPERIMTNNGMGDGSGEIELSQGVEDDETSSEFTSCASEIHDTEDIYIDDDSGQSQFYISLEESEEQKNQAKVSNGPVKSDQQFTGFFKNVKRMLSSPKHQPSKTHNGTEVSEKGGLQSDMNSANGTMSGKTNVKNGPNLEVSQQAATNVVENGIKEMKISQNDSGNLSDCVELSDTDSSIEILKKSVSDIKLPPPSEFGAGNPFLMFLCLTLLLQHRELILQNKLEYDEIAIMFDKLVRKHNVHKVLHQARNLYSDYLRTQQKLEEQAHLDPSV